MPTADHHNLSNEILFWLQIPGSHISGLPVIGAALHRFIVAGIEGV